MSVRMSIFYIKNRKWIFKDTSEGKVMRMNDVLQTGHKKKGIKGIKRWMEWGGREGKGDENKDTLCTCTNSPRNVMDHF